MHRIEGTIGSGIVPTETMGNLGHAQYKTKSDCLGHLRRKKVFEKVLKQILMLCVPDRALSTN